MPDTLAHMRHVAELANDTAAFTPHAALDISANGARWLLMLLPIVEAIADTDPIVYEDVHPRECFYCGGSVFFHADTIDVEHREGCVYAASRALKEGAG